jgi:hypothetical protein
LAVNTTWLKANTKVVVLGAIGSILGVGVLAVGGAVWHDRGDGPSVSEVVVWLAPGLLIVLAVCMAWVQLLRPKPSAQPRSIPAPRLSTAVATATPATPAKPPEPLQPTKSISVAITKTDPQIPWVAFLPEVGHGKEKDTYGHSGKPMVVAVELQSNSKAVIDGVAFRIKGGNVMAELVDSMTWSEQKAVPTDDPDEVTKDIGSIAPGAKAVLRWIVHQSFLPGPAISSNSLWWLSDANGPVDSGSFRAPNPPPPAGPRP